MLKFESYDEFKHKKTMSCPFLKHPLVVEASFSVLMFVSSLFDFFCCWYFCKTDITGGT